MKKFFLIALLAAFSLASSAQIGNLFKPINSVLQVTAVDGQKALLDNVALRLNVGITTTQSSWNKETKAFDHNPMAAAGFGLGVQHYVARPDGSLFNNYGGNLLILVPSGVSGTTGLAIGLFGNIDIFQLGVDYNFALKKVSLDTGITFKF